MKMLMNNLNANTAAKVANEIAKVALTKNLSWHPSYDEHESPGAIVVVVDGEAWDVAFDYEHLGKHEYIATRQKDAATFYDEIPAPTKEQLDEYGAACWSLFMKVTRAIQNGEYVEVENAFAFASPTGDWTVNAHAGVYRGHNDMRGELVYCDNDGLVACTPASSNRKLYDTIYGHVA